MRISVKINQPPKREGSILVMAAVVMAIVMAFAAFTVDLGMITVTKGQLQNAADSAAHATAKELLRAFGPSATLTPAEAETAARARAVEMVGRFRSGDVQSTIAVDTRDVRFGNRSWDEANQEWLMQWGVQPYNMVEVTARRTAATNSALPMTFARFLGISSHDVAASSIASVAPINGFEKPKPNETVDILPIAVDLQTWESLMVAAAGNSSGGTSSTFKDVYRYANSTGGILSGSDGVLEFDIYPDVNTSLPPGNRGTVDLGSPNNSTADLKRQIVNGLNEYDMSYFPNGELMCSFEHPVQLNGDPGISAGIEASLKSIIGQVRAIPIFTQVSGPGNNANYTVVKFVGVRIMAVNLKGGPKSRYLMVQPAEFSSPYVIRSNGDIQFDSIVSQPYLIR
ncbi:MAG: hypothetical protein KDA91_16860 [Planctomycetaceae bacterium]|nr:hypothetical protein [Planctomycetaceae bacterium]